MSSVNESVVREYFEQLGYLVSQPRKYVPGGRQKTADEELDLIVFNPQVKEHKVPEHLIWSTGDLKNVSRAVVGVRGWHTERFYVSRFEQTPDILRFVEEAPIRFAEKLLGASPIAKILCIPNLPASGGLKDKTCEVLKLKGLDGVISFRTMLLELAGRVDVNVNYEKSDLLQTVRLLKNYDLIKDSQMDMFAKKQRRPRKIKSDENSGELAGS
ncbi:MAG: hypothetical protein A2283_22850 [Lentisphaerae bacterium RIFOXYA12_FULL_48_11]|nr:MAG: hypothetical protein A2283_22850 [Lentisphaerae bacterium RIFOXYA12_FULL_48_11]